jgi:ferredoxin
MLMKSIPWSMIRNYAMECRIALLDRPSACMECGACQLNCVTGAIAVESGVGCAAAMIRAALTGQKEATCDC